MPNHQSGNRGHGQDRRRQGQERRTLNNADDIRFVNGSEGNLNPELFNTVAQAAAKHVADVKRGNESTQLRRFYDEIVMWNEKVQQHPERFAEYLPFIRMLNAKAVYAEGRKLVDGAFVDLIGHCVKQVNSVEDMRHFKLFMEAFMGFYKLEKR